MIQIALSEDEAAMLRDTLDAKLRDLRREISHTDSPRFRETLERLEDVLQRLVDQLGKETPSTTA